MRQNRGELGELLDRASVDAGQPRERERRYIFNGDSRQAVAGYSMPPNKRGIRRKVSTFNMILVLFGFGIAIVLYINNIIVVNQLAADIDRLQKTYAAMQSSNAALQAEVNKKSSMDRIGTIATQQLGLQPAREQPRWFDIDEQKLEELKVR